MNKVAVLGLGYVGLPLATLCAKKGYEVVALDKNKEIIESIVHGRSHIIDKTVQRLLAEALSSGCFTPTSKLEDVHDCSIYLICVPTPVDSNFDPDLKPLKKAINDIASFLTPGDMVVVESTVFPGTCEDIVQPLLEAGSGLRVGDDIHLAHCPERVNPGDDFWTTENIPRVLAATTNKGSQLVAQFYSSILDGEVTEIFDVRGNLRPKYVSTECGWMPTQTALGSVTIMRTIRDAEAVKVMENTVRDVNIAFVNELAKISDVLNLDVVDVIDGMSTKPFGKGPFFPGIGVGGHCIAVDPEWLKAASLKAGYMPEQIQLARNTNKSMPSYSVGLLQDALNDCGLAVKDTAITLLGVAYKKNVDDQRESPFFEVRRLLQNKGAKIRVYDSWIAKENTTQSLACALKGTKAIVIITDHDDCVEELKKLDLKELGIEVVIDGRNCLSAEYVTKQGIKYRGVGRR